MIVGSSSWPFRIWPQSNKMPSPTLNPALAGFFLRLDSLPMRAVRGRVSHFTQQSATCPLPPSSGASRWLGSARWGEGGLVYAGIVWYAGGSIN